MLLLGITLQLICLQGRWPVDVHRLNLDPKRVDGAVALQWFEQYELTDLYSESVGVCLRNFHPTESFKAQQTHGECCAAANARAHQQWVSDQILPISQQSTQVEGSLRDFLLTTPLARLLRGSQGLQDKHDV